MAELQVCQHDGKNCKSARLRSPNWVTIRGARKKENIDRSEICIYTNIDHYTAVWSG